MTSLIKIITIALFIFVNAYSYSLAQAKSPESLSPEEKIDGLFKNYNSETPGVAVVIIQEGKVVLNKAYGMANLEHAIPITSQTVFNIASVAKQFTAFATYLLEAEGRLSFDDDISKYIPELPSYGKKIRIKHLLAHTSGLKDQWSLLTLAGYRWDDVITSEHLLKLLSIQKNLNFTPGTEFSYSNTGYFLLGEIIERITGSTFAEYSKQKIFTPLGMSNTRFYDNHRLIIKNKADSYYKIADGSYLHNGLNHSITGGSNLMTNVDDLSKWALNFEDPVVGDKKLLQAFNEPSVLDDGEKVVFRIIPPDTLHYAKGQIARQWRGLGMFNHGGHDASYRSFLVRIPEKKLSIITLSNDESFDIVKSGFSIAEFYLKDLEQSIPKHQPAQVSTEKSEKAQDRYTSDLTEFIGRYSSDELLTSYKVEMMNDSLVMKHERLNDIRLKRTGDRSFSGLNTFYIELEFTRDENKLTNGFTISNFGAKNVRFKKNYSKIN